MPLTVTQNEEIITIIDNIKKRISKNIREKETSTKILEEICALLEKNAEIYSQVRRQVQVVRGDDLAAPSGDAYGVMAVTCYNLIFNTYAYQLLSFSKPNSDEREVNSVIDNQIIINFALPIIQTLLGACVYKMTREVTEKKYLH